MPFQNLMRSVNDGRHKLIVYPQLHRRQLFDLQNDPDEITDLSADPAHADTLQRLEKRLVEEQKVYGDKQPLKATKASLPGVGFNDFDRKPDQWQPQWIIDKYFPKR
jgi:arylsulfatase A-like enzyme